MVPALFPITDAPQIVKGKLARTHKGLGFRWLCRYDQRLPQMGLEYLWSRTIYPTWREAVRAHHDHCTCAARKQQTSERKEGTFLSLPFLGASTPRGIISANQTRHFAEKVARQIERPLLVRKEYMVFRAEWGLQTEEWGIRKIAGLMRSGQFRSWPDTRILQLLAPPDLRKVLDETLPAGEIERFVAKHAPSGIAFFQDAWTAYLSYLRYEIQMGISSSPAQECLRLVSCGMFPVGFLEKKLILLKP